MANEAAHLAGAKALKIPVVSSEVVNDKNGRARLLVKRFDRYRDGNKQWHRLPLEDGTQVMTLPPAAKYGVASEEVALALAERCEARLPAIRDFYLQFLFAWLTGNGDLHAKNLSILGDTSGGFSPAPVYDVPCTLPYGDETMALPIADKVKNIRARHWAEFAANLGLPPRAAASANRLALKAATSIDLERLPFEGSPLRGPKENCVFAARNWRHRATRPATSPWLGKGTRPDKFALPDVVSRVPGREERTPGRGCVRPGGKRHCRISTAPALHGRFLLDRTNQDNSGLRTRLCPEPPRK